MRRFLGCALGSLVLLVPLVGTSPAAAEELSTTSYEMVQVEAVVEGRSQLTLSGGTAQWHHLDGVAPGRSGPLDRPTVINDAVWLPVWPDVPDRQNRDCDCYSDVFSGVEPPLLDLAFDIDLRRVEGLGAVSVVQNPSKANGYTTTIEFDDRDLPGADRYIVEFDLRPEVPPGPNTLRIKAHVDGLSRLVLQGSNAYWHHISYAAPGRHFFVDEPTVFGDIEWYPMWPDIPDAENRDCDCNSSSFDGVRPALPLTAFTVELRLIRSRGTTAVVRQPTASNGFTTVIEFDDVDPPGPAWYIVEFDLPKTVPPLVQMRQRVRELQDAGVLRAGQANALLVKLDGVQEKRLDGRLTPACGQLQAFAHQVRAFGRAGQLTRSDVAWFEVRVSEVSQQVCVP